MAQLLKTRMHWTKLRQFAVFVIGLLLALQVGIAPAQATGVYEFPATVDPSTWVMDEADILSRFTEGNLNQSLGNLASQTGKEVRMLTIHRLDYGETVQSFTDQLFEQWFPTPESQANQILVVLDNVTNTAAIRTGAGVKDLLTGDQATSVTQETMLVPLRDGDRYNQAFLDAGDRLVAILSGQPDPGPPVINTVVQTEGTFATPEETKGSNATAWVIGLLIAATVIPMVTYYIYVR